MISERVERIFSHAVAMDQQGRLKNTIYITGREIYILNSDNTILLRFILRTNEAPFKHPISFKANDYDSRDFYEEGGQIVFVTEGLEFIKKKKCGKLETTPQDIANLYEKYDSAVNQLVNEIQITSATLPLLDESLSHIEIRGKDKSCVLIQRDIFSGNLIELARPSPKGLAVVQPDKIETDFGPIGIKTSDFLALFAFQDVIKFHFPKEGIADYCYIKGIDQRMNMTGFVSGCLYDELGAITESRIGGIDHGREITEEWKNQSEANKPNNKKFCLRRANKK